ncbi:MAG: HlyD family efflux transporter periplasmic adaptor subunit [Thermacetogeniaceae bacterium]
MANYDGEAVVLRNEIVVKAPCSGQVIRIRSEGSLVRAGELVAKLRPKTGIDTGIAEIDLFSPVSGYVCYHPDGWEDILTPSEWSRLEFSEVFGSVNKKDEVCSQEAAAEEPVFKIIDNLSEPYLIVKIKNARNEHVISQQDRVEFRWNGGSGKGKVVAAREIDGALFIVVEVLEAEQRLPDKRLFGLKVIKTEGEGVVLPAKAIVWRKGATGVITSSPLGFRFHKVEITGRLGEKVAVKGIEPGLEVVVNPSVVTKIQKEI